MYLDQDHPAEPIDWLAIESGYYTLDDGTIIEAGTFPLAGNKLWQDHQLKATMRVLLSASRMHGRLATRQQP